MHTDNKSQTAPLPRLPKTMQQRLFAVSSMLSTIRMAFINQMQETGMSDLYDLAITTEAAADMLADMAVELDEQPGK